MWCFFYSWYIMEQGDNMKLKRVHLYIIAFLCFAITFVAINRKYDRFYRVNGINNDNRALIEMYLDEQEQDYLVENAIAVNKFIKYIEEPDFILQYYEFYNMLDKTKKYANYQELISTGNQLAGKLEVSFASKALANCKILVKNDLVAAYLNQGEFDFDNIRYYQLIRPLYDEFDFTYIQDTNSYLNIINEFDDFNDKELYRTVKQLSTNFTKTSLNILFNTNLQANAKRIYNPSVLSLVVNDATFIGGYEPKNLVPVQAIPRTTYFMYLQEDTYTHLMEMYRAYYQEHGRGLILTKAYIGYDVANLKDKDVVAGYNEYQLGSTVNFKQMDTSTENFGQTEGYQWLVNHCHEYGFILRYPSGKESVTNHSYSATTFRYVGKDIATKLHENNLALEEYTENEE